MRGFPIRKSSDHGSFANSPRLIAGYYVLLRLLVPRHPPCALINLTTKIIQRCSRPLCSSQATTGHRKTPRRLPTRPAPTPKGRAPPEHGGSTGPHGPDQGNTHHVAVPSGPNSVPSRPATNRCTPVPSPQQAAGVLESHRPNEPASSRCSTREHHPGRVRTERGPGHRHHPMTGRPGARCSLERR